MKKMKLIYLEWEDATANAGWFSRSGAEEWGESAGSLIKQVGWLIAENKEFIVFASRWDGKFDDDDGNETFGGLQKIPKTWIRKRKVIKI